MSMCSNIKDMCWTDRDKVVYSAHPTISHQGMLVSRKCFFAIALSVSVEKILDIISY